MIIRRELGDGRVSLESDGSTRGDEALRRFQALLDAQASGDPVRIQAAQDSFVALAGVLGLDLGEA